jgi:hypothetical protein
LIVIHTGGLMKLNCIIMLVMWSSAGLFNEPAPVHVAQTKTIIPKTIFGQQVAVEIAPISISMETTCLWTAASQQTDEEIKC